MSGTKVHRTYVGRLGSQFAPGRVGARAVRVLVEQTVVFDIQRG